MSPQNDVYAALQQGAAAGCLPVCVGHPRMVVDEQCARTRCPAVVRTGGRGYRCAVLSLRGGVALGAADADASISTYRQSQRDRPGAGQDPERQPARDTPPTLHRQQRDHVEPVAERPPRSRPPLPTRQTRAARSPRTPAPAGGPASRSGTASRSRRHGCPWGRRRPRTARAPARTHPRIRRTLVRKASRTLRVPIEG
jgi:hypothetical protein